VSFYLSTHASLDITVYEQDTQFGGRAGVDAEGEHCPRFFLDDYVHLFDIMRRIEGPGGRTLYDTLRRVRRYSHISTSGWVEISHLYRLFAREITWAERFRAVRAWRPSPLVAERRRARSANRYGSVRSYSLLPLLRLGPGLIRSKTGYTLCGPTDEYLVTPWTRHLRERGVTLRESTRVTMIRPAAGGVSVRTTPGWAEFDAVVVTAYVPDLVNLLDGSRLYHRVVDLEQIHCVALTIQLDPRERILQNPDPAFYSHKGINILVQPESCRCVVLCTGSTSTRERHVLSRVADFLGLEHDPVQVRMRTNQRPGEAVFAGDSLRPERILRRPVRNLYFAGSCVRNSYPIDSAESAARSALNAVRAMRFDFGLSLRDGADVSGFALDQSSWGRAG
jgi:predicted NAD/FAD-binding protein